ncbi:MAG: hypothetical protein ACM3YE_01685 [Bacteroidota bacterium]
MNTDPVIYQEKKTSKLIIIAFSLFTLYFGFSYFYQGVLKLGLSGYDLHRVLVIIAGYLTMVCLCFGIIYNMVGKKAPC